MVELKLLCRLEQEEEKKADYIKCKLCDWKVKRFWKSKKGKLISGQNRLRSHFIDCHFDEFLEIQDQINDDIQLEILEGNEKE